ncbi:MAG: lamin tail domain-containing protein, partial [Planctomycetes bacterium]|nr:lamin tail domain-containing protein [Planctomycetota bacterium]
MWASFKMCITVLLTACCGHTLAGAVSDIVINEFMASNGSAIQDGQGQYDDWIELHNTSDTPVDVGGLFLTDDLSDPTAWQIPLNRAQDTIISAQGYLIIWADRDSQ